jgi:hypothetical protein
MQDMNNSKKIIKKIRFTNEKIQKKFCKQDKIIINKKENKRIKNIEKRSILLVQKVIIFKIFYFI